MEAEPLAKLLQLLQALAISALERILPSYTRASIFSAGVQTVLMYPSNSWSGPEADSV